MYKNVFNEYKQNYLFVKSTFMKDLLTENALKIVV